MNAIRRILFALVSATIVSNSAFAESKAIVVKGIKVDGGAMSGLGTTLTFVNDQWVKNKYLGYAGWGLIIGGLVIGSGSTANANAKEVAAKDVWNSVRSEARLVANNSLLIDESSAIVAAANKSEVSVHTLAGLTQKVDEVTSQARTSGKTLSVDEVVGLVNANAQYRPIVANMAQIALIAQ